jgi:hypothetical protein
MVSRPPMWWMHSNRSPTQRTGTGATLPECLFITEDRSHLAAARDLGLSVLGLGTNLAPLPSFSSWDDAPLVIAEIVTPDRIRNPLLFHKAERDGLEGRPFRERCNDGCPSGFPITSQPPPSSARPVGNCPAVKQAREAFSRRHGNLLEKVEKKRWKNETKFGFGHVDPRSYPSVVDAYRNDFTHRGRYLHDHG